MNVIGAEHTHRSNPQVVCRPNRHPSADALDVMMDHVEKIVQYNMPGERPSFGAVSSIAAFLIHEGRIAKTDYVLTLYAYHLWMMTGS